MLLGAEKLCVEIPNLCKVVVRGRAYVHEIEYFKSIYRLVKSILQRQTAIKKHQTQRDYGVIKVEKKISIDEAEVIADDSFEAMKLVEVSLVVVVSFQDSHLRCF